MIPALTNVPGIDPEYQAFFSALKEAGFTGDIETSFSSRLAVATDNSVYQWLPQGAVFPKSSDDVVCLVKLVSDPKFRKVRFTPRGGGTGTNGQSLNSGIVVDLSRHMTAILEHNAEEHWVRVQPGVIKDDLNSRIKSTGYFFSPDLSTSNRATIGGMISTDASGQGARRYGRTSRHVLSVSVVLMDGTLAEFSPKSGSALREKLGLKTFEGDLYRIVYGIAKGRRAEIEKTFPDLNRFLTGYDLKHVYDPETDTLDLSRIICGSEGTLAFIVEAKLDLTKIPAFRALVNVKYDSFDSALRNAPLMMKADALSVETVDSKVLNLAKSDIVWYQVKDLIKEVPGKDLQGINIVEFSGDDEEHQNELVESLCRRLDQQMERGEAGVIGYQTCKDLPSILSVYAMRKKSVGLLGKAPGDAKPIPFTEDTAVPPEHLADYILEFRALLDSYHLKYGMFGHIDCGVLHVRPALDMTDPEQEKTLRRISDRMVELTKKYGGLMWGEHGRGFRSEYGPKYFGDLYPELRKIKKAFDPDNRLNPGKIAVPEGNDEKLVSVDFQKRGSFDRQISLDVRHDFSDAMGCNGNGQCFTYDLNSPMCPSYKLTRDRRFSPKGRSSLIREWLRELQTRGIDPRDEEHIKDGRSVAGVFRRFINTLALKSGTKDFSREVWDAMQECLACKACASQCPVKVDVSNFRARFLNIYYQRYSRPLKDMIVRNIEKTVPLAASFPRLMNALTLNPVSDFLTRKIVGFADAPAMSYPALPALLAELGIETIREPERLGQLPEEERKKSILFVEDAFTRVYDAPVVAHFLKLVKLLGFRPYVLRYLPNGKTQHVKGFLHEFYGTALRAAGFLNSVSAYGIPLVGLDPAMVICYRDEYTRVLKDLRGDFNVMLPQEWLLSVLDQIPAKPVPENAETYYLLAHCQERTLIPSTHADWEKILSRFGVRLKAAPVGCCGMAGIYGHDSSHLEQSKKLYSMSWGPVISKYGVDHCVATGYSCRSQVYRMEDRAVMLHPLELALKAIEKQEAAG